MQILNIDFNAFAPVVPKDAEIPKQTFIERVKSRLDMRLESSQNLIRLLTMLVFYRIQKTPDGEVVVK